MKKISLITAAIILAACSGPSAEQSSTHTAQKAAAHNASDGLVISAARVLPPFPGRDIAAGYFEITNHGSTADRLVSATSPISGAIEIHNHIEEGGVMKMRRVDGVEIAPGETIAFKPGSYHLMMFKTQLPDDQKNVSLTLNYQNADPVTLIVDIEGREDIEAGSGYGSSHEGDENYGSSHKGD